MYNIWQYFVYLLNLYKVCRAEEVYFGKSCYFASFLDASFIGSKTWHDASDYCKGISVDNTTYELVSIQSEKEFDFLSTQKWKSTVHKENKYKGFHIWIGLHLGKRLIWSDGSKLGYGNPETKDANGKSIRPWNNPEPNNLGGVSMQVDTL